MGLTFIVAPTLGTSLYAAWPQRPMIIAAAIMAATAILVLAHPQLRRASQR